MTLVDYVSAVISSHFTAGFAGALVRSITARTNNLAETIVGGISGALCAGYGTPAVVNYLDVQTTSSASTVAFLVGLLGVYLAESLMRIAARYAANPTIPTALTPAAVIDAFSNTPSQTKSDDQSKDS